jgi:abhydrolase domain-containing protein 12
MVFLQWINWPWTADYANPETYGFLSSEVKNFQIPVENGRLVGAWEIRPKSPRNVVCLYLHGNAGNRLNFDHLVFYKRITRELQITLISIDYRGFGDYVSPFQHEVPTELGVLNDTLAAWEYLSKLYMDKKKCIIGHSLGTALSTRLSLELVKKGVSPDALIIMSSIESVQEVMADYPGFNVLLSPVTMIPNWKQKISPFIADKFNNSEYLQSISPTDKFPLLMVHGVDDTEVLLKNSRLIFSGLTGFTDYDAPMSVGDSRLKGVTVERTKEAWSFKYLPRANNSYSISYIEVFHATHNDVHSQFSIVLDAINNVLHGIGSQLK